MEYAKCRAWRIDPLVKGPHPDNTYQTTTNEKSPLLSKNEPFEENKFTLD